MDQLLEILGSSDNLLQEELTGNERAPGFRGPALVNHLSRQELVLKIAILAEKNAKNIGWYVDAPCQAASRGWPQEGVD